MCQPLYVTNCATIKQMDGNQVIELVNTFLDHNSNYQRRGRRAGRRIRQRKQRSYDQFNEFRGPEHRYPTRGYQQNRRGKTSRRPYFSRSERPNRDERSPDRCSNERKDQRKRDLCEGGSNNSHPSSNPTILVNDTKRPKWYNDWVIKSRQSQLDKSNYNDSVSDEHIVVNSASMERAETIDNTRDNQTLDNRRALPNNDQVELLRMPILRRKSNDVNTSSGGSTSNGNTMRLHGEDSASPENMPSKNELPPTTRLELCDEQPKNDENVKNRKSKQSRNLLIAPNTLPTPNKTN